MPQPSFSVDQPFLLHGVVHRILHEIDDDTVLLKSDEGKTSVKPRSELLAAYNNHQIVFPEARGRFVGLDPIDGSQRFGREIGDFSPAAQAAAKYRRAFMKLLLDDGPVIVDRGEILTERIATTHVKVVQTNNEFSHLQPPHPTTVWRWNRRSPDGPGESVDYVPAFEDRGGPGLRRASKKQVDLEHEMIERVYLRDGGTIEDVVEAYKLKANEENQFLIPKEQFGSTSASSIYRAIRRLDPYEVAAARIGEAQAKHRFRGNRIVPVTTRALEIVEIDETPLDLFVIDFETGMPWGRPYFTAGVDRHTGMPWGMCVHFGDPSSWSALACIANGIKPKTYVNEWFPDIRGTWPVYGIPISLRCDNALWYHGNALADAALTLGFNVQFCPKRRPNWKASIEAFMKAVNYRFAHGLPGTSLAHYWKRKDYNPFKVAVVDTTTLNELLYRWLIDDYMNNPRRKDGKPRIQVWREAMQ